MNIISSVYWLLFPRINKLTSIIILILLIGWYLFAEIIPIPYTTIASIICARNSHYEGAAITFYTIGAVFAYYKIDFVKYGKYVLPLILIVVIGYLLHISSPILLNLYLLCGPFLIIYLYDKYGISIKWKFATFFIFGFHYWPLKWLSGFLINHYQVHSDCGYLTVYTMSVISIAILCIVFAYILKTYIPLFYNILTGGR